MRCLITLWIAVCLFAACQSGEKNESTNNQTSDSLIVDLNRLCKQKFGVDGIAKKIYDYQLYLDMIRVDSLKLDRKLVKQTIVTYLKSLNRVWTAYDIDDFSKVILPAKLKNRLSNSFYFRRSGDIQLFYKAQYTDYTPTGLEHGAWYAYDTHIPLLFYGWNIRPGKLYRETYMTDIAATIAAMLKIQMPNGSIGDVIDEVLK